MELNDDRYDGSKDGSKTREGDRTRGNVEVGWTSVRLLEACGSPATREPIYPKMRNDQMF